MIAYAPRMRRFGSVVLIGLWGCGAGPVSGTGAQAPEDADPGAVPQTGSGSAACIAQANAGDGLPDGHPARISVNHILVKHVDAKRAPDAIARSRDDACLRAAEALAKLKSGVGFEQLVADYSDEEGAATRAGSLGAIKPTDVLPAFAAAAFALELNQVSNVVETPSGFHIILRTE